jgi:hypothetical protein
MLDDPHVAVWWPMPGGTRGSHHTYEVVVAQDRRRFHVGEPVEQCGQSRPDFPGSSHITITNHVIGMDAMLLRPDAGGE